MTRRQPCALPILTAVTIAASLTACSAGGTTTATSSSASSANATSAAATASGAASSSASGDAASSTSATSDASTVVNTWKASTVDKTKLPLGDDLFSTSTYGVGKLFGCQSGNPNAGGAIDDVPWIDYTAKTWDLTKKSSVQGSHTWPTANYTEKVEGGKRTITTNGRPVKTVTGTFPIASTDPAYAYDRNPGSIGEKTRTFALTDSPAAAAEPTCTNFETIGILKNGVPIFSSIDGRGHDAVAHEVQDVCGGHPAMTTYHYHSIPTCLVDLATGSSTVVGYALDGFPIVVERDAAGNLPSNADLDQCHGRSSPILVDGKVVTSYHYSATLEYPYTIGCFTGTPITLAN